MLYIIFIFIYYQDDVHELVQISGWLNLKWTDCMHILYNFNKINLLILKNK